MYAAIRTFTSRVIDESRVFLDRLSAFDGPHGDYLFGLEARIHHREAEVTTLQSLFAKPTGDVRKGQ